MIAIIIRFESANLADLEFWNIFGIRFFLELIRKLHQKRSEGVKKLKLRVGAPNSCALPAATKGWI